MSWLLDIVVNFSTKLWTVSNDVPDVDFDTCPEIGYCKIQILLDNIYNNTKFFKRILYKNLS